MFDMVTYQRTTPKAPGYRLGDNYFHRPSPSGPIRSQAPPSSLERRWFDRTFR